jgi:hypothetical protein
MSVSSDDPFVRKTPAQLFTLKPLAAITAAGAYHHRSIKIELREERRVRQQFNPEATSSSVNWSFRSDLFMYLEAAKVIFCVARNKHQN